MTVIPVVHERAAARAAIRRGLPRRTARLAACRDLGAVRRLLDRELVDAIILDVRRSPEPEDAFALAAGFPRIPVFAFSAFRPDDGPLLAACRRAGFRGVLVEDVDTPVAGQLLGARLASRTRLRALRDGPRLLRLRETIQRRVWEEVFRRAARPVTTAEIARSLRRSREHLSREFAAGGAPNLKRVIDLARVACAADLLGNPAYSVGTVTRVLGFSSPSHLAGVSRRIAGVAPSALGALGPRGVLARFLNGRTRSRI